MNIAITGGNGFLGTYVVRTLRKQGFIPTLLDRTKHNLLQPEALKDFVTGKDVIIHLAGVNRGRDEEIIKINYLGTKGLLDAMTKYAPTAKLIFASTFQVYLKNGAYGESKRQAEEYIRKSGVKAIILRIANIYGPGCKPFYNSVIATFAYQIKQGKQLVINGDGSQKRDYIYVTDAADAILKAINYEHKTTLSFDICLGTRTSLKEIVELFKKLSAKKITVRYNKAIKSDDWEVEKNCKETMRKLGWQPKTRLEEGLKAVLEQ